MAGQQQQQQQGGGENALAPMWITLGLFILAYAIWYFAHEQIVWAAFQFKLWQIHLVSLFTHGLASVQEYIQKTPPATVGYKELNLVMTEVGNYLRYPIILILVLLAVVMYFASSKTKFRKEYSMKELANLEKVNWPQITPVVSLNLVDEDVNKGPWAMAMNPMQFAKKHKLLEEKQEFPKGAMLSSQLITVVTVKKEEADTLFKLQMGAYWKGPQALNAYTAALFAIFAARISGDREGAANMIAQIASSSGGGKLDFSGIPAMLRKYANNKDVVKVCQSHSFILTVMAAMLENVRIDGVFASADFLWLKPIDRKLWYMLNCVGRQTPFAEIAGPFAHWLSEKELKRRLVVPMIGTAVEALEEAIKGILYTPDEEK